MKRLLVLIISVLALNSVFAQRMGNVTNLSSADFAAQISRADVVLVDVRSYRESIGDHIDGGLNVEWHSATANNFKSEFAKLKILKDKTVAVYCQSGKRSRQAATMIAEMGYNVINLDGGLMQWRRDGFPSVKREPNSRK